MSIEERLKYAVERRDDSISNGTIHDVVYWNGYIDAINAIIGSTK